jgi:hypothetical protein
MEGPRPSSSARGLQRRFAATNSRRSGWLPQPNVQSTHRSGRCMSGLPIIFECARANPELGEIRRLAGEVRNWDEVVGASTRLGVAPLLFWSLCRACPNVVPGPILASLRSLFRESTKRDLVLTTELLRLLALFRQADIEAVPFKGPALAAQLYDPTGLRPSGDLDVLMRRADVPRAIDVALSNGYRPLYPHTSLRFFDAGGEIPLIGTSCTLELHWLFAPSFFRALRPSCFLSRLTTVPLGGFQVPTLRAEDLLPVLCVHGGKHGWNPLKWLCDIARLMESPDLDWDVVIARSEAMHVTRPLALGVGLARDLLSAPVPPEMAECIARDHTVQDLAASIRATLASGKSAGWRDGMLNQWRLLTSWRDRTTFWTSRLVEPAVPDWQSMPMPPAIFPLYYLLRPLRLAWKWGLRRYRPS